MIGVLQIVMMLLFGIVIPMLLGILLLKIVLPTEQCTPLKCMMTGFAFSFVLFQLLCVPMLLLHTPFHILFYSYVSVCVLLSAVSILLFHKVMIDWWKNSVLWRKREEKPDWLCVSLWIAVIICIMLQVWLLAAHTHRDTDDSRFIAEALEALEKDTMLSYHPLTGEYLGKPLGEMKKDMLSPYPIYLAYFAKITNLPPAVSSHVLLPILLIPLCYGAYYLAGCYLFHGEYEKKKVAVFLFFLALIHFFAFDSPFAPGYTLLAIIWQGRSVFASVLMPLLWYFLMRFSTIEQPALGDYLLLTVSTMSCIMVSNMGTVFAAIMVSAYALAGLFTRKSIKVAALQMICIIPNCFFMLWWMLM